jgi:hypothetical protein
MTDLNPSSQRIGPHVRHAYTYCLDQCDVTTASRPALEAYRAKRAEWLDWLDGDPEHSIHRQISGMMWADAAYRAMNEARRFDTDSNPIAATAPLLAELLDQGFVASMILAVGKLTDPVEKAPARGVLSLRRVIADIRKHRHLTPKCPAALSGMQAPGVAPTAPVGSWHH